MLTREDLELLKQGKDPKGIFSRAVADEIEPLHAFLLKLCRNADDAEEVMQRALAAAFVNIHRYNPDKASFRTWLFRIAVHKHVDMIRSRYSERACLDRMARCGPLAAPSPAEELVDRARAAVVWRWLSRFELIDQIILVLRYMEGRTCDEVAQIVHMPSSTVKQRCNKTLYLLKLAAMCQPVPRQMEPEEEVIWRNQMPGDFATGSRNTRTRKSSSRQPLKTR